MRIVGLGFLMALLAIRYWDPAPVEVLRLKTLDLYHVIQPRVAKGQPVVIVDIDERSLALRGQWPWPRTLLADLTQTLFAAGAAAVGFDIVFAEPDRLSPGRLADSLTGLSPEAKSVLRNAPDTDAVFAATLRDRKSVV